MTPFDWDYCEREADAADRRRNLGYLMLACLVALALLVLLTVGPADSAI